MCDKMKNCLDPLPQKEREYPVICMCDYCGSEVCEGDLVWQEAEDGVLVHDECLLEFAKSRMYERVADEALLWEVE